MPPAFAAGSSSSPGLRSPLSPDGGKGLAVDWSPVGESDEAADWRELYGAASLRDVGIRAMLGLALEPVYGPPGDRPGPLSLHPGAVRVDVPLQALDDAHVRRLRHGGRHQHALQELLRSGGDGLSVAFDLPTLMGRDSDDPLALGEVGRAGWPSTPRGRERPLPGIDLAA